MAAKKKSTFKEDERVAKLVVELLGKFRKAKHDESIRIAPKDVHDLLGTSRSGTLQKVFSRFASVMPRVRLRAGGVEILNDSPFQQLASQHTVLKHDISRFVAEDIEAGSSIACTDGSTVAVCVRQFAIKDPPKYVSVVTNNAAVLHEQLRGLSIEFSGGEYSVLCHATVGKSVVDTFVRHNFAAAVIGTSGVSKSGVLTVDDPATCPIRKAVIEATDGRIYLVADVTKLGKTGPWWHYADIRLLAGSNEVVLVTNDPRSAGDDKKIETAFGVLEGLQKSCDASYERYSLDNGEFLERPSQDTRFRIVVVEGGNEDI